MTMTAPYDGVGTIAADCPACRTPRTKGTALFHFGYGVAARSLPVTLRRCSTCRFMYLSPRPNDVALRARCYAAYNRPRVQATRGGHTRALMFSSLLDLLERQMPQPRVLLDVGCATGRLMSTAEKRGWRTAGVEADPQGAAYARAQGLSAQCCTSLADSDFRPASFGAILMIDSLYYFADPAAELRWAQRLLSSGGCLLIRVPNRQWIVLALHVIARIAPCLRERLSRLVFRYCASDALWICHLPTLKRMLAEAGFRDVRLLPAPASRGEHGLRLLLMQFLNVVASGLSRATGGRWLVSTGAVAMARNGAAG